MNKNIEEALEEIKADCRGRYRFRLNIGGLVFYSEPVPRDRFLIEFENLAVDCPDLTGVQYESKSEYTPGNYIWQTF